MKKLAFLFVFLFPAFSYSQEDPQDYHRYRLPEGTRIQMENGDIFQAYTLEEMKVLLEMDADLLALMGRDQIFLEQTTLKSRLIDNLTEQIKSKSFQIFALKAEVSRITEKWKKDNKDKHLCENKPSFWTWVAYGTAAVAGSVALALGIVMASGGG